MPYREVTQQLGIRSKTLVEVLVEKYQEDHPFEKTIRKGPLRIILIKYIKEV